MVGCEKRERNRVGWEMDLSEEWYKGNGMGVPEGSGVKKRGEGEDWGGPGKVRSDPLGLKPRPET